MKKQNPIDDLFRRELEDYRVTPSAGRRAALMGETGRPGFFKPWWILGIVAVIFLGVGISVYVSREPQTVSRVAGSRMQDAGSGMQDGKSSSNPVTQKPTTQNPTPTTQHPKPNTQNLKPSTQNPTPNPQSQIPPALASSSNPASQAPVGEGSRDPGTVSRELQAVNREPQAVSRESQTVSHDAGSGMQDASISSNPVTQSPTTPVTQPPSNPVTQSPTTPVTQPPSNPVTQPPSNPAPKTQNPPPNTPNPQRDSVHRTSYIIHPDKDGPPKNWHISLGAYYSPEWMFNTLNGDKFVNNAGVEGTFHFGKYSVRTGVGLSITTGSNEMVVESNEYLGSYSALDSITFKWDYSNYRLVPTYYTTGTKVYDTSLQYTYTNNKKRYTYLQIPLVLGYDFWQNNWFSLGVRGGAVMSVLLKSTQLSDAFDPGQSRVVTVNNVSPDRVQLNWQAMAGINAAFRLSRRFSFEVEPDVRYYFNSVYESSQLSKKPWSVGVRAAFVVTW